MARKSRFLHGRCLPLLLALFILPACRQESTPAPLPAAPAKPKAAPFDIQKALSAYAPAPVRADLSMLTVAERQVLRKLVAAARDMDEIFWRQVDAGNIELRESLSRATDPAARAAYQYLLINRGPFDRLRQDEPFAGSRTKPPGANFYPADMKREEFEQWILRHPADQAAFRGNFTVIRRRGEVLLAVPYSVEYRALLEPAAEKLREAAALCRNPSLRKYLTLRARDLLRNDYYESDLAWMSLRDTPLEPVLGPYEVYEDRLFGYKASFEAFITIRNPAESKKLAVYEKQIADLEAHLPIPRDQKFAKRGGSSPISVTDAVFVAGDGAAGAQTAAFNLPNDERVRQARGSKKVLLRNVMQAKFDRCLRPIAERVLEPALRPHVAFQAFFDHTLFHEISHGMGPGRLEIEGRATTVSAELKDLYPAIEEGKADITGLWSILYLMDRGAMPPAEEALFSTYLAGIFRSIRFGTVDAHGLGTMLQYNFLKKLGAIGYDPRTGRYRVESARMRPAVAALTREFLMLEATADYDSARAFIRDYGVAPSEVAATIATLDDLPVDIAPVFESVSE